VAYTPIEISPSTVLQSTRRLSEMFAGIEMLPVCADFTQPVELPHPTREPRHTAVFFPGSTLGNFANREAVALLRSMRATMGPRGEALIGIDLDKDSAVLEAAYNDAAGVTAAFTLNLLVRLNRDLGSDFDLDGFEHRAVYTRERGRIVETFLVSRRAQSVHVRGKRFSFEPGEAMHVEYSHKYTDAGFADLAQQAGLKVVDGWNDPRDWFGLRVLVPA
jgi:dimethylhistidine N-methyltransferase